MPKFSNKEQYDLIKTLIDNAWRAILKEKLEQEKQSTWEIIMKNIDSQLYEQKYCELDLLKVKYDLIDRLIELPERIQKHCKPEKEVDLSNML